MRTRHKLVMTVIVMGIVCCWATGAMAALREYCSTDVPKTIPEAGTITSKIIVPDSFRIKDVDVTKLHIKHNWNCDLDVFLIHGDIRVKLFTDVGGQVDDFENTILDDEAEMSISDSRAQPPFRGEFKPMGNLSDFDFTDAQGEWVLEISDDSAPIGGTLLSWCLVIEECLPPPEPRNPNPADDAVNVALTDVCLKWQGGAFPDTTWDVYFGPMPNQMSLLASNLSEPSVCLGPLEMGAMYYWQVIARNICGQTPSVGASGPWAFTTAGAPVAICRPVIIRADKNCQAVLTVDDIDCGSYDPSGYPLDRTVDPTGPYPRGTTPVTLTVVNSNGASDSNSTTVTVLDTAYCFKKDAFSTLARVWLNSGQNDPNLVLAIDYIGRSLGDQRGVVEEDRVFWADPDRIAHRQGGYHGEKVFELERKACILLDMYVNTTGASDVNDVNEAWRLLAEADKILADTAIADAIFQGVDASTVSKAKKFRNEANTAKCTNVTGNITEVLEKYYSAWRKAIDGLGSPTDYNRDGVLDSDDLLLFSDDMLTELTAE